MEECLHPGVAAACADMTTNNDCVDCAKKQIRVVRYKSASLAISRAPVFFAPIQTNSKKTILNFKARAQRQGGRNRIDYKAGITGSESRFLQGIQGVVSTIIPGNPSAIRSPIRSRLYSAVTPGGIPGINVPMIGREERGYRCPEGYQYGGRFTDSRLSTCGQKLFDIARQINAAIGELAQSINEVIDGQETTGRLVEMAGTVDSPTTRRRPQIPRVGAENKRANTIALDETISSMSSAPLTGASYRRLIRRDGFILEPVVSAAVLRTVPDNRDMEGSTYITSVSSAIDIGTADDIGLLSNTGVRRLSYVLPGGSVISLEKARTLTVGERRKLGRTIRTLDTVNTESDPAARLKAMAAEMGSGIAYTEKFNIDNPNDIVETVIPGTNNIRQVKRWYYESLLRQRKGKLKNRVDVSSRESGIEPIDEKITNLQYAIRHLNSNGNPSAISSKIRAEAIKRSRMYKERMLPNGLRAYDKPDGQTLINMPPTNSDFDHIGALVSADIQKYLEMDVPQVYVAGTPGRRRPYLLQESTDIGGRQKIPSDMSTDSYNSDDLLRLTIADWVSDVRDRDPLSIVPISARSGQRAVASINRNAALSGLRPAMAQRRGSVKIEEFYSEEYLDMIRANFEKRAAAQRKLSLELLSAMIVRLKEYDIDELYSRLSIDGEYTDAEKAHLKAVGSMIETRINILSSVKKSFSKLIGLSND